VKNNIKLSKYNVYGEWGSKHILSTNCKKEVEKALGQLRFGEGYEVRDDNDLIITEFIPF
jgi:hypothetical protein